MGNEPPKPAPKPAPKAAAPAKPRYSDPDKIPAHVLEGWLQAVGFNEMSTRRLMEVNPRLALIAIEAKYSFDKDPVNQIKDKQGHVIGHKTFQIPEIGGFRTVNDQRVATGRGNSQSSPSRFQSFHQHGHAFDFWIYDHNNKTGEDTYVDEAGGGKAFYDAFERVADKCVATPHARAMGLTRDDMRITLHGRPDWGHIELPERFRADWTRNPTTGVVVVDGRPVPGTGIDPDLHKRPGPTYALIKPS
jgi:hypothetical protein